MSDPHGDEMLEVLKVVASKCGEVKAIFRSLFHGYHFQYRSAFILAVCTDASSVLIMFVFK